MQIQLPPPQRAAFSNLEHLRVGEVWRLFQELAIACSVKSGWPPARYADEGLMFIVRSMSVRHLRPHKFGGTIVGETGVSRVRRETFFTRESSLSDEHGVFAEATQEWVTVSTNLVPTRASLALFEAFPVVASPRHHEEPDAPGGVGMALPDLTRDALFADTDPLDHVNHTVYADWCEGALSVFSARSGVAPKSVVPVMETIAYRAAIEVGQVVTIKTTAWPHPDRELVQFGHEILADGAPAAKATLWRRFPPGEGAIFYDRTQGGRAGEPRTP